MAQIAKRSVSGLKEASKGPDEKAESRGKVSINVESPRSPSPTKKLSKGSGEGGTPVVSIDPKPGNNSQSRVSLLQIKRIRSSPYNTTQNDLRRYNSLES